MNLLEQYLDRHGLDEEHALNLLQQQGVVSDNCVEAADVADADCERAIQFLKDRKQGRSAC